MSCYVCLEECNEKSPCECKHIVHEECLHKTCKSQHIIHCTICKSNIDGYVFRNETNIGNNGYNIIDSDSDGSSTDYDSDDNNSYYLEVSKCKYFIFYLFWWIALSIFVSLLWVIIVCMSSICSNNGYKTLIIFAFCIEFIIICRCFKK